MDRQKMEQRYCSVEKLILKTCRDFSTQFGMNIEDAVSEAHEIFVVSCDKFDPNRGAKFSTYIRNTIWFRLMDQQRKIYKRNELLPRDHSEVLNEIRSSEITKFDFDDFIAIMNLSNDAIIVIKLCLSNRFDSSMRKGQQQIRKVLMDRGWTSPRCTIIFKEINNAISNKEYTYD